MLVQQHLLLRARVGERQQALLRGMEPALGVEGVQPFPLPGLPRHVLAHKGKAPRLHLLRVAEDHQLLAAIGHRRDRRQVDLRALVDDDDVEEAGQAGEEAGDVVRAHDPDRQQLEHHRGALGVRLHAVEEGEVLEAGLVALEDARQLPQPGSLLPRCPRHRQLTAQLQRLLRQRQQPRPPLRDRLSHRGAGRRRPSTMPCSSPASSRSASASPAAARRCLRERGAPPRATRRARGRRVLRC